MELLIITAVQSYEKDIKRLLKESEVKAFSHMDVTGYKDLSDQPNDDNWFASNSGEHRSALFYAFVEKSGVDKVLNAIAEFNKGQDSMSYVHAVVVDVKRSI